MPTGPLNLDDLSALAREAHATSGLTQSDAAERLGVTPQAYGSALKDGGNLNALRMRIIKAFSLYSVEGPKYERVKKGGAAS